MGDIGYIKGYSSLIGRTFFGDLFSLGGDSSVRCGLAHIGRGLVVAIFYGVKVFNGGNYSSILRALGVFGNLQGSRYRTYYSCKVGHR